METSLTRYRDTFRKQMLEFLWRQWSALGVAGSGDNHEARVIDPEALLLFSTVTARHDPRLFDEILDWLQINGAWINIQRLARLQKVHDLAEPSLLAAIAGHVSHQADQKKWKNLTRKAEPLPEPRPLFTDLPVLRARDEIFLRWGWERNKPQTRGMSQFPPTDRPATFLFKLRALFGCQSRADIIGWLLIRGSGHPAAIARELGYFRGSVQAVLNDLSKSGHIRSMRVGREKHFSIEPEEWRFLITWPEPKNFPQWENWIGCFTLLENAANVVNRADLEQLSADVQAIEIKQALDPQVLARTTHATPGGLPATHLKGEAYLAASVSFLNDLTL